MNFEEQAKQMRPEEFSNLSPEEAKKKAIKKAKI
jgi:hypothetical protein